MSKDDDFRDMEDRPGGGGLAVAAIAILALAAFALGALMLVLALFP